MKVYNQKSISCYATISLFVLSLFFSCKSFKQPSEIQKPLDYTNEDVIQNEIKNIRELQEKESTKALFRACLLNDSQIIKECADIVEGQAQKAIEEKLAQMGTTRKDVIEYGQRLTKASKKE